MKNIDNLIIGVTNRDNFIIVLDCYEKKRVEPNRAEVAGSHAVHAGAFLIKDLMVICRRVDRDDNLPGEVHGTIK